ncbi:type 1 glutamine amidotransferase [Streptomyces sp. WMMC500]|uniref:type 1 glutamine amidotransferase n=1 Tax=Streptomyces sp. WMMC500 TaxID=3015154 RepID=UPI00248CB8D2|nr:type 1 glutamine amidotransferase [Streptomyces sp. WMMC500]WBB63148.1 type 1 glutamine amidotransferase [Streptomyces sp. WMMC500]
MTKVLVVQNGRGGGPRRFGAWLEQKGVALDVVHAYAGAPLPRRLDHAAILPLGGGPMPDDDAAMPWLAAVRELVAEALARDVPVFGICQGGQLLAHVAGGRVTASHGAPELGSTPLTLRPEAADDPLFTGLPRRVTAVQRHVDAITALPPGAVWLAESERCPHQAFRCGDRAWGVQFHPEAGADRVRAWSDESIRARGFDPARVRAEADRDEQESAVVWGQVAHRFARAVRAEG